jgi:aminoglycoside phosphotransferase (APT) family kinase protein
MSKDLGAGGLKPDILAWVAGVLGGEVVSCERITGGASRQSFALGLAPGGRVAEAFLRVDTGSGPLSGTDFTLQREVSTLTALNGTKVRIPEIYGFNTAHQAVLMEKVPGTSNFFSVADATQAAALQDELLTQLALLHRAPIDVRKVFGEATPRTVREALREDVRFWGELLPRHVPQPEPVITFALDWLYRRALGGDQAPVVVHGDIGPGNFMFEGASLRAMIDWELVHAGHPLEDLAAIIARTLGVPFGDLRRHVDTYGKLSGTKVDPDELDYCIVLVLTRWCIGMSMGLAKVSPALDVPIFVKFMQVNLFAIAKLLARLSGQPLPPVPEVAGVPGVTRDLYGYAAAVLGEQVKPALSETYLKAKVDGIAGLLSYLRNLADYGIDRERREELEALESVLDGKVESVATGRAALADALRNSTDEQRATILRWLLRKLSLQHALLKEMLGPMYERELDYRAGVGT